MFFRPCPKPGKKPKRSGKPIATKAVFKAHGANTLKCYRRRFTDAQVMAKAEACRRERLMDRQPAEIRFAEMLDSMRILYEAEKIFLNGDRWICADFYFKAPKLVVELDGSQHRLQAGYDRGRDAWLLERHGIRTIRFSNQQVFRQIEAVRLNVLAALL